jgi:hypothetical protein
LPVVLISTQFSIAAGVKHGGEPNLLASVLRIKAAKRYCTQGGIYEWTGEFEVPPLHALGIIER